jgi:hypothetical protein
MDSGARSTSSESVPQIHPLAQSKDVDLRHRAESPDVAIVEAKGSLWAVRRPRELTSSIQSGGTGRITVVSGVQPSQTFQAVAMSQVLRNRAVRYFDNVSPTALLTFNVTYPDFVRSSQTKCTQCHTSYQCGTHGKWNYAFHRIFSLTLIYGVKRGP